MQTHRRQSFNRTGKDLNQTSRPPRPPIEGFWRRALALGLAGIEVAAIVWLLRVDLTTVHQVTVTGLSHLTRDQVVQTAGLSSPGSVLLVDGDSIQRDLERLPWVRTASVQPLLPDRVSIAVQEWAAVAVYRNGTAGRLLYLNDQGTAVAPAAGAGSLPLIQGSGPSDPKAGSHPIDAQLLAALIRIQAALPAIYGQPVAAFQLDCVGSLSLTTARGVAIYFGRVLTPEEFASLSAKLSALKSIAASDPDVGNPAKVLYINLEDVQQPAVKFKGDKPSPAAGAPSPSPSPLAPVVQAAPCR